MSLKFEIKGMHCKSCKMLIEDALEDEGIKVISITVDEKAETGKLEVEDNVDSQKIIDLIKAEGDYEVSQR